MEEARKRHQREVQREREEKERLEYWANSQSYDRLAAEGFHSDDDSEDRPMDNLYDPTCDSQNDDPYLEPDEDSESLGDHTLGDHENAEQELELDEDSVDLLDP